MRTKSWPLWETWKLIFGKDRACGRGAEQLEVAANRVRAQQPVCSSQCNENDYHPSFEDFPFEENTPMPDTSQFNDNSSGNTGQQTSMSNQSPSKRKKDSPDALLMEFLRDLHKDTNARLEMISTRIGYENLTWGKRDRRCSTSSALSMV